MKKFIILFILLLLLIPIKVKAQYEGPTTYQNIDIEKWVGYPSTKDNGDLEYIYVDNLGVNDYKFSPLDYLFFKVRVRNLSNIEQKELVISDFAPDYAELYNDPGNYNSDSRTLIINVGTLAPGEEKEYIIRGRIVDKTKFASNVSIFCALNKVRVENSQVSDEDTAHYCIEITQVKGAAVTPVPIKTVPKAGPQFGLLLLGGSGVMAFVGKKLRKTR